MEDVNKFLHTSIVSDNCIVVTSGYDDGFVLDDVHGYGVGYGSGAGFGDGCGDEQGCGCGCGVGDGYGSEYGDGFGDDSRYGYGYNIHFTNGLDSCSRYITSFNGEDVYVIDGVPTIITRVHGNYATGVIIRPDLTTRLCYIAKCGIYFAHAYTLEEAIRDAQLKYDNNSSVEERIMSFWEHFNNIDKYPAKDFFDWHTKLTGSCSLGKLEFCRSKGIDIENDMMTVDEFINYTIDSFKGFIIRDLKHSRNEKE